jgi:hypothetical protein
MGKETGLMMVCSGALTAFAVYFFCVHVDTVAWFLTVADVILTILYIVVNTLVKREIDALVVAILNSRDHDTRERLRDAIPDDGDERPRKRTVRRTTRGRVWTKP